MNKNSVLESIRRLRDAQFNLIGKELIAPVLPGIKIKTRIDGFIHELRATGVPQGFTGMAYLKVANLYTAKFVDEANVKQSNRYLNLFPSVQLILVDQDNHGHLAVAAHQNHPVQLHGEARVYFAGNVNLEMFDKITCRFDGTIFMYQGLPIQNRRIGEYLRNCWGAKVGVEQLNYSGLTPEHKAAYAFMLGRYLGILETAHSRELENEQDRLKAALEYANASLNWYRDRGGEYVVNYEVGGQEFTSIVNKGSLQVQTAGVCLAGNDRNFDLTSLVTVLQVGIETNRIYVTSGDYDEEDDE